MAWNGKLAGLAAGKSLQLNFAALSHSKATLKA